MLSAAKSFVKHAVIRRLVAQEAAARRDQPLVPALWGCGRDGDGCLTIGDIAATELARQFGTPLQVLNEAELLSTYANFRDSFAAVHPDVVLATSYKTNPVPHVLKLLHGAGSHAEVISHFELWLALRLGVPPDKIIVNGPGKSDAALRLAVERQVRIVNIDGPGEIAKLARYAGERGTRQRVGLRVTTSVGWSSQFGLPIASGAAEAAFRQIKDHEALVPAGLHLHLGTGIQSIETYARAVQELVDFAAELRSKYGIVIDCYDLGGGFGVPTVRGKSDWDTRMVALGYPAREALPQSVPRPADFAAALAPQFERLRAMTAGTDNVPTVVLEPGRAITSSAQVLLLSVIATKPGADNKTYVIVDGGKNITMPLEWETHKIFAASCLDSPADQPSDIFGPLCHPGDIICKNQNFPALGEGDVLAIMDAGAYFIPNQTNFSNPRPAIVSVRDGRCSIVRRRETFEDIVQLDEIDGTDEA